MHFGKKHHDPLEYSTLRNATLVNNIGVHKFIFMSDVYARIYDSYAHKSELHLRKAEIRAQNCSAFMNLQLHPNNPIFLQ